MNVTFRHTLVKRPADDPFVLDLDVFPHIP